MVTVWWTIRFIVSHGGRSVTPAMNRGKTRHIGNLHVSSLIVYQTELNVENYESDTLHHAATANDL